MTNFNNIFLSVLFVFQISFSAHSSEKLHYETTEDKNFIETGIEMGSINAGGTALTGAGIKLGYSYLINESFLFNINLVFMGTMAGGLGFLYTGIIANAEYAVLGRFQYYKSTLSHKGSALFTEKTIKRNILSLSAGPEQLFFNGTKSVFPVTGIGFAPTYRFNLFSLDLKTALRYSVLVANSSIFTAIFLSLSMDLRI